MNFKPTKLKVLFSAIAFVITDVFLANQIFCTYMLVPGTRAPPCPPWTSYILEPALLGLSLAVAILVYCVWSSVEKKKN